MHDRSKADKSAVKGCMVSGIIAILVIAATGAAILFLNRQFAPVKMRFNNDVTLTSAGLLTSTNSKFIRESTGYALFKRLPVRLQGIVSKVWKPNSSYHSIDTNQQPGGFGLVFHFNIHDPALDEKVRSGSSSDLINDVAFRLNYGEGYFGQEPQHSSTSGLEFGTYILPAFNSVPVTLKRFQLELLDRSGGRYYNPRVTATTSIPNPLYDGNARPLKAQDELPTQKRHGDVTVTLEDFVTRASSLYQDRDRFNEAWTAAASGKAEPAKGTAEDPNTGIAVLRVSEAGTTESQWKVKSATFSYGQSGTKFDASPRTHTSGGLTTIDFTHDPGVLKQPVRMQVSLVRHKDFTPDETARLEMPIPPKGRMGEIMKGKVWSGEVTVQAGNDTSVPFAGESFNKVRKGMLGVYMTAPVPGLLWEDSLFVGPNAPPVRMAKFRNFYQFSGNNWLQNFDVYNAKRIASSAPGFNLDDYTTMSLVLRVPKDYEKTFDFVLEPRAAGAP